MLLSPDDVALFFKLHRSLMHFVNQRLGVVPDVAGPEEFSVLPLESRAELRNKFLDNADLIESFVNENPENFSDDETDIVLSWRHQIFGQFYIFRQLKNYMVFLSMDDPPVAYGVVALSEPIENIIGPNLPRMTQSVLMPFKGKIVYDGLLSSYNVSFGGGVKRMLNDSYRQAKQRMGVVTSLPIESIPISAMKTKMPKKRKPKKTTSSGSKDVKPALQVILGMTDDFCDEHLDSEYAELCRRLAKKLSRKRPSPLLRGRPKTWACGIIRTIGWVNFLDDSTAKLHMKLTAIDKALGVGESTGQGKSKEIRTMLKIHAFDMDWTLPSQMDDNLLGWMVEVNGFAIDVRNAPREIQEIAFGKGMIPYIPAGRESGSPGSDDEQDAMSGSDQIYQFKITLCGSDPPIWRRIHVENCSLDELHEHIQTAMGWTNSHLHQFEIKGKRYGDPQLLDDGFGGFSCIDSTLTKLSDIVPTRGKKFGFLYEYDFGDGWEHEVLFEGCAGAQSGRRYPLCVEGERACPPEDVGGVWGYTELLEAVNDPNHEQHEDFMEWAGNIDPDEFDAVKATKEMRRGMPDWRHCS